MINTSDSSSCAERPGRELLDLLLEASAARHHHLCPRQILGVRMALRGLLELTLIGPDYLPRYDNGSKRLLTIVETDGCAADGVSVTTDCTVGHRTLRILDYGKVAVTLVNTESRQAVRVIPSKRSRGMALAYRPGAESPWHAYLEAYGLLTDHELLAWQPVTLTQSIHEILSRPDARAICQRCGEEIMNEREVLQNNQTLCWTCAHGSYYLTV